MASNGGAFSQAELEMFVDVTGWPMDVITDPTKQAMRIQSVEEFRKWLFFSDFTTEAIILENGIQKLGLENVIPQDIKHSIFKSDTVLGVLEDFTEDMFTKYSGKICFVLPDGKDEEPKFDHLQAQLEYIKDKKYCTDSLYLTELRYKEKYKHPVTGESTKTACAKDGKDVLGEQADVGTLYWDRYDTGIFIGNSGSGMGLHSDQVFWSNFGKQWSGYKLLGVWPQGPETVRLLEEHRHKVFARPPYGALDDAEMAWVEKVHRVCLLRPGDIILFSAAGAHMAINICDNESLAVSAYESFVNFHPKHIELFLNTGNGELHHESFIMDEDNVYDIKDDMLDHIEKVCDVYPSLSTERQRQFVIALATLTTQSKYFARHVHDIMVKKNLLTLMEAYGKK